MPSTVVASVCMDGRILHRAHTGSLAGSRTVHYDVQGSTWLL